MLRKLQFRRSSKSRNSSPAKDEASTKWRKTPESSSSNLLDDKRVSTEPSAHLRYDSTQETLVDPVNPNGSSPFYNGTVLGLSLLHQPPRTAPVDIIFVHGLGGNSCLTWSQDHDPTMFWPQLWLPSERHVGDARIFTFGYNANFKPGSSKSASGIGDFAKELLYELKYARDQYGDAFGLGRVPIVFVAHSMGGLVVKKAYFLGQNDETYQEVVTSISSIVFLATPHRGAGLAELLNRIHALTFRRSRTFVRELSRDSATLEDLNEQFRHIAPRLIIYSFYESLSTACLGKGPKQVVVGRESSILGYDKEVLRPLEADHHGVCKYSGPNDSNYIAVRNALIHIVEELRSRGAHAITNRQAEESTAIQALLGPCPNIEKDFESHRQQWMPGTCDWIFDEPSVKRWLHGPSRSRRILWYTGPPGTGKSVLASHLINHLRQTGASCQFFFFRDGDQSRRSAIVSLKAIIHQLAASIPEFKKDLLNFSQDWLRLNDSDPSVLWRKLFEGVLFRRELEQPLYWVIDAVDESESPRALLGLLASIANSRTPIHILLVSRRTDTLSRAIQRLTEHVHVDFLEKTYHEHNQEDIQRLIADGVKHMSSSDDFKDFLQRTMTARADGNFLWVRLVLEEIHGCHTEHAIRETLDEIPDDMNEMYRHMEQNLLRNRRAADIRLSKSLLQYIICAQRDLSLDELTRLLQPEFSGILDLRRTLQDLCGQFIVVDDGNYIRAIHQTARDFLTQASTSEIRVSLPVGHSALFKKAMASFDLDIRPGIAQAQVTDRGEANVDLYASNAWFYHLEKAGQPSDSNLDHLVQFFKSTAVLNWIQSLALDGRVGLLVKASKALSRFSHRMRRDYQSKSPLLHRLADLELLDQWSIDLIKIVGKFGVHLAVEPSAIYNVIPPLCPEESALHQQFYSPETADLVVSGMQNPTWNDNLAKWNLPQNHQAWKIMCTHDLIVVQSSRRCVFVWSTHNFAEVCTLQQDEPIIDMCLNKRGSMLVTYGTRSTKLWSLPSGSLIARATNPPYVKAMAMAFCKNDSQVVCGSDDRAVRTIDIDDFATGWQTLNASLLHEDSPLDGTVVNSPMCMAFNGDGTQIGVSYRGFPLSAWSLLDGKCIRRCSRAGIRHDRHRPSDNWFGVDRFTWNPVSGHIIGIYKDGCVFKWHPVTNENREAKSTADEVAASSDGKLFVTSSSTGTLRIWNFAYFTPIYQLSSDDLVIGLAFSPDHHRFYDVRGNEINAWEPNSLVRFAGAEDQSSDAASEEQHSTSASHVSEANVVRCEAVSALAASPSGTWYCYGNEAGRVELCDARTNQTAQLAMFHNMLSVSHLDWNAGGDTVAAADLGGDVVVSHILHNSQSFTIQPVSKPHLDLEGRGISQLLLNHDATMLLVATDDICYLVSTEDAAVVTSLAVSDGKGCQWLRHPTCPEQFLALDSQSVRAFHWKDFAEAGQPSPWAFLSQMEDGMGSQRDPDSTAEGSQPVRHASNYGPATRTMLCQDGQHVLAQLKRRTYQEQSSRQLVIIKTTALGRGPTVESVPIPDPVGAAVEHALGVLPGSILVFLDRDLWVCTYPLASPASEVHRRHFFVPRDWLGSEGLGQCCLMSDGTMLCPKDDRVAVVRGSLDRAGF